MRKFFKKVLAGTVTTAMVATMFVGIGTSATKAADTSDVTLTPWSFYEGGNSFRGEKDPWAQRFYNSVKVGSETITGWGNPDAGTLETTKTASAAADNFTADIMTTGWDGSYDEGGNLLGNNPYLLKASMEGIKVTTGHDYTISFKAKWTRTNENAPEKNITIGVDNSDESVFAQDASAVTQIKVANGSTVSYSQNFTVWSGDGTLKVTLAYGCHLADFKAGSTTENTSASGKLEITDVKIVDKGQNPNYVAPPERDDTTVNPGNEETTTTKKVPTTTTTTTKKAPVAKKFAKVKKLKAVSKKKGVVKISWRKVKFAKKYQIKVGKKTYKTSKIKYTVRKLKKGKVVVKVRVNAANGYKASAWVTKRVKVK